MPAEVANWLVVAFMFVVYVAIIVFVLRLLWRLVVAFESIARSQETRARITEKQFKQALVMPNRPETPPTSPEL